MAQKRQKSSTFEKSGLAQAGAEVAAIAAQRRKAVSGSEFTSVPPDINRMTDLEGSLPRPSVPPIPAPRHINNPQKPSVHQPESTGKQPPKPLPRTRIEKSDVEKSEPSGQITLPRSKVVQRAKTTGPKRQPPPPIAPKPALYQLKQRPEGSEDPNRRRSSTLPQSWRVGRQLEIESGDTKDVDVGGTTEDIEHQHGIII